MPNTLSLTLLLGALPLLTTACGGDSNRTSSATPTPSPSAFDITKVNHVVVIYQENWSYDSLYSQFPGSNGYTFGKAVAQTDISGNPITVMPQAINNDVAPAVLDARFAAEAGTAVTFWDMKPYVPDTAVTGDIVHRYYTEQLQINNGKMDQFLAWSDNPGLVLGGFDATKLPEGKLAQQFVMCDNSFHSAFGGSFLNHQYLISAQPPVWPNALTAASASAMIAAAGAPKFITQATVETSSGSNLLPLPKASLDGTTLALTTNNWPAPLTAGSKGFDNQITINPTTAAGTDYYAVNTLQPSAWPFSLGGKFLPYLNGKTIGESLSTASVSWKWYSGGWDQAVAGNPDVSFQYHHQPFNYYAQYAPGMPGRAHLVDLTQFDADLATNSLPAVSFVKFLGEFNEHPGYTDLASGQQAVVDFIKKIQNSSAWKDTLIIITYDENGGRWDHVAPPKIDAWGPGTRVPTILVSPFVKTGFVDHTQYETVSILAFIEKRWNLAPLGTRDAAAAYFLNAFDPAK